MVWCLQIQVKHKPRDPKAMNHVLHEIQQQAPRPVYQWEGRLKSEFEIISIGGLKHVRKIRRNWNENEMNTKNENDNENDNENEKNENQTQKKNLKRK